VRRVADEERADEPPVWIAATDTELGQARERVDRQLGRSRRRDVSGRQARERDARGGLSPVRFAVDVVEDCHVYLLPRYAASGRRGVRVVGGRLDVSGSDTRVSAIGRLDVTSRVQNSWPGSKA